MNRENEQGSAFKTDKLEVFREALDNLRADEGTYPRVSRTLYEWVSGLLDAGDIVGAARMMVRENVTPSVAIDAIEEDYGYSSSTADAVERGESRIENATTIIIMLEKYEGFLPDEIKTIIRGGNQYREFLRSNLGYPRYYSKEPQDWRLKEILLFTVYGIKAVKVEEKISRLMQDTIRGLSDLNREDWMNIVEDIRLQGATTNRLNGLVRPLNRAEILRREYMKELPSVFNQHVSTQSQVKAEALLSTIKSFEPVNLLGAKFDLGPRFDAHFLNLSATQLNQEFSPDGKFKVSTWGNPLIDGLNTELRRK